MSRKDPKDHLARDVKEIAGQVTWDTVKHKDPRSLRSLARELGVSDSTVRRWLEGGDWPDEKTMEAVRQWVKRHRALPFRPPTKPRTNLSPAEVRQFKWRDRLKRVRSELGLSQRECAERIHPALSVGVYQLWERETGGRVPPDWVQDLILMKLGVAP